MARSPLFSPFCFGHQRLWALMIGIALLAFPFPAIAQSLPENNALDAIVDLYLDSAGGWHASLQRAAISLFWLLAGIEIAWTGVTLALRGASLSDFLNEFLQRVLAIGFFFWLLTQSQSLAQDIVASFRAAADGATIAAGGRAGSSPGEVFDSGVTLAGLIWDRLSLLEPGLSLALSIAGIIVLVVFCLLAAMMTLAMVEAAIVMNAGVIILGFGGGRWTRPVARGYLAYALSVGVKLFLIQLIIGLGESMITGWAALSELSARQVLVMIGASIVLLALSWSIPSLMQGVISGSAFGAGGQAMSALGAVGAAGSLAASGVIGAGLAAREAALLAGQGGGGSSGAGAGASPAGGGAAPVRLGGLPEGGASPASAAASEGPGLAPPAGSTAPQAGGSAASSPASASGGGSSSASAPLARAGAFAGGMARALAGAAMNDIGARATGARRSGVGTMPGRMAADLRERRVMAEAARAAEPEAEYPSPAADLTARGAAS